MFRLGFAGCVCVAAIISGEAFSQERTCPNSSKDFIVGEATKGFIKQCLGTPDVDKPLNDGHSLYFYALEQATKSSMIYKFDSSERLVTYHLTSHKGGDAEGLLARRDRERMATKVAAQQADIRAATEEKERQARIKKESGLSAQSMYLQAGKYDRNGQQSDAVRLYELLIEKYPNHALTIQANNRLIGIKSENNTASTNNAERSRASFECKERKKAYTSSCYNLNSEEHYACISRARSLCSE